MRSLQLITELWNNRDKSITNFDMYNDIFIDTCIIDAVYKLLVELQKQRGSIDVEYRGVPKLSPLWGANFWHLTRVP